MTSLGIDTSNYATSLAVIDTDRGVVCAKKRFLPVKKGELGLRQSDALFHHTIALPEMLAELEAETALCEIEAVGVSVRPRPVEGSYMPCFLAGRAFAVAFAAARCIPLVETSHQQGHIMATQFAAGRLAALEEQAIVFHVSGGTTEMLLAKGYTVQLVLGKSLDLYAGQAVDRLGVKLGFDFPAGPRVSALAAECIEEPKPSVSLRGMDCHLSGLQNQCEALLDASRTPAYAAKYCLYSIADTVSGMIAAARKTHPGLPVLCAGGVMSSDCIRTRLESRVDDIMFVPQEYSSDNAIGVALIAAEEAVSCRV